MKRPWPASAPLRRSRQTLSPVIRLVAIWVAALGAPAAVASNKAINVAIDVTRASEPVTRYEYGMFIEPIGGLISRTLWAEMLDARKFYYPVLPEGQDAPVPRGVEGRPGTSYRRWRPVGGPYAVSMNRHDPYTGAQSAVVTVHGESPRGISQEGIGVAKRTAYAGHLVLRGDATAIVRVTFVWGEGPSERQVCQLPALERKWTSVPFELFAPVDATNARLEISGTGSGQFQVGAASLMPADNINGWRADSTRILKSIRSGVWRLPGGNFESNWDWHGAIGPRDRRAPMFDRAWSAMQPNDLGMDEYMELARIIGVEPYVTVNAGLGDANSAAEEVEYLNGSAESEWGSKRAANGHPTPYGVRLWNIGNEPYGWWQIGKTSLEYFMMKHNEFAAAMRAADPSITLIGSGAMPDQLHPKDAKENASLESVRSKFGTEEDWTGGLFTQAWGTFEGVSEHWYDRAEKRVDAPAEDELIEFTRSPSNQVRMKADEWKIYQQRFPTLKEQGTFLAIDEYAYFGEPADLKLALAYSLVLQEMLRYTDFLKLSAFTMGVSTLDVTPTGAVLNSTGEVFKLYGDTFGPGTVPIAVDGNSPQPAPRYPVGFDHPQARAGSPTYPLDVVAGMSPDRKTLKVAVVNPTLHTQSLSIGLKGLHIGGRATVWRLTGPRLDSANKVGQPAAVTVQRIERTAFPRTLAVPPISISIFEVPVTQVP